MFACSRARKCPTTSTQCRSKSVPKGRLKVAQGEVLGMRYKPRAVPKGRLKFPRTQVPGAANRKRMWLKGAGPWISAKKLQSQ